MKNTRGSLSSTSLTERDTPIAMAAREESFDRSRARSFSSDGYDVGKKRGKERHRNEKEGIQMEEGIE